MKIDVLITDGNTKHGYAAIRALHKEGLKVAVICPNKFSLSYFSVFPLKKFAIDVDINSYRDISKWNYYYKKLLQIIKSYRPKALIPIGNSACSICSENKKELSRFTAVPIADFDKMKIARNKFDTFKFAKLNKIPMPQTFFKYNIDTIVDQLRFPCVLKPTNIGQGGVKYSNNKEELICHYNQIMKFQDSSGTPPIIQEYIQGEGNGYYGLYDNGKCLAYFIHKRIHEFPITGGASCLAKSNHDSELKKIGHQVLSKLKWHGVAMVEFKKDKSDGKYKLMEINPKFWGSLELSYKAGINFAYLDYLLASKNNIPSQNYKTDIFFQWVLPNDLLWHIYNKKWFKVYNNTHTNIYFDDILVNIYNIVFTVYKMISTKRYPHGRVKK